MSTTVVSTFSAATTGLLPLALSMLLGSAAQAQQFAQPSLPTSVQAAEATADARSASPSAPAGRSRAEVIAELVCARASGELEAWVLRSHGLPTPPLRKEACAPSPPKAQV
ncbi:hypothetical protein [Comamonas sp. GB3 AK4-5]|uniref:hypothetical protein n=1 Tax=Comamonas sp. GB3 AK4-5 TaxID=3231487 RepID=UPI00351F6893